MYSGIRSSWFEVRGLKNIPELYNLPIAIGTTNQLTN